MVEIPDIPDLEASEQAHDDMLLGIDVDQTEEMRNIPLLELFTIPLVLDVHGLFFKF